MSDPSFLDSAVQVGGGIIGGGGALGVIVRFLMGGVTKRLDTIDKHISENRKDVAALRAELNERHEKMLERVVKVESSLASEHRRLDALVTPTPLRDHKRRRNKTTRRP